MSAKSYLSWIVFGLGGLAGFFWDVQSEFPGQRWLVSLVSGYLLWSLLWGLSSAWFGRFPALARLESLNPLKDRWARWILRWTLLLIWACLFSILGGGLYEYVQALRMGRRSFPAAQPSS